MTSRESTRLEHTGSDQMDTSGRITFADLLTRWPILVGGSFLAGLVALGFSFLIPPTFTSRALFLPPQQTQNSANTALASLGALAGLAGGAAGSKSTGDQFVSLMQSMNVQDRLIDQFKLMEDYAVRYRFQARQQLAQSSRINFGKKDGLISVEVDASSPKLAADLANGYITELRRLAGELALTEAKQRRVFFESELKKTQEQLALAQQSLQKSGFNPNIIKAEPKAAVESFARLRAEVMAAEIKLNALRQSLANSAPEVQQQQAVVTGLREQLRRTEQVDDSTAQPSSYISLYRSYKYQESLFELFSRQYEAARLDESRDNSLIQIIDHASVAEHKSKPKRAVIALTTSAVAFVLLTLALLWRMRKSLQAAGQGLST